MVAEKLIAIQKVEVDSTTCVSSKKFPKRKKKPKRKPTNNAKRGNKRSMSKRSKKETKDTGVKPD